MDNYYQIAWLFIRVFVLSRMVIDNVGNEQRILPFNERIFYSEQNVTVPI